MKSFLYEMIGLHKVDPIGILDWWSLCSVFQYVFFPEKFQAAYHQMKTASLYVRIRVHTLVVHVLHFRLYLVISIIFFP